MALLRVAALIVIASTLPGCATIINGTTQKIDVSTDPPGATIATADGNTYTSPTKISLPRNTDHILTVSLAGYQTEQVHLTKTLSGVVAGNIIAGGLIGWGVDAVSGAQYKLVPSAVSLRLRPYGYPSTQSTTQAYLPPTPPPARTLPASTTSLQAAPTKSVTLQNRLDQLRSLRDNNYITESEYQKIRSDLLVEFGDA